VGAHLPRRGTAMKTLLIIAVLILILWNLGAGLYYMLVDKGESKRTVNALTRRIALSVALIIGVVIAAKLGWIEFHGVGRNP
jgi:hypothetical protein